MVKYKCERCQREFKQKGHLKDHLNRKKPCEEKDIIFINSLQKTPKNSVNIENIEVKNDTNNICCGYCGIFFSRKDNLTKHINNSCKVKKTLENEKEKMFKLLLEQKNNEINELKELIKEQGKEIKKCFNKLNSKNLSDKEDIIKINKSIKKLKNDIPENEKKIINNQLMNIIIDKEKKIDELINNKTEDKIIINDNTEQIKNNKSIDLSINNHIIMCRETDKYINATQLCKAGGKKFSHWICLDSTKELIKQLEKNILVSDTGIPASLTSIKNDVDNIKNLNTNLIDSKKGKSLNFEQGTWIHPDLAIQLAQWISPQFALQVSSWIRTLFLFGKVEVNLKLKEQESKIKLLEDIVIKKQKRNNYPDKNVIYLITNELNIKKRIYIIGKAVNLKDRLSTYNKSSEHQVIYYKSCKTEEQMELVEKMVLNKLDEFREKANRDRFILPFEQDINYFINIISTCIDFFN